MLTIGDLIMKMEWLANEIEKAEWEIDNLYPSQKEQRDLDTKIWMLKHSLAEANARLYTLANQ